MINIVVLDDEIEWIARIRHQIQEVFGKPGKTYKLREFDDEYTALSFMEVNTPDILFLDVYLHLMSGFEFLQKYCINKNPISPEIVIVSTNEDRKNVGIDNKDNALTNMYNSMNLNLKFIFKNGDTHLKLTFGKQMENYLTNYIQKKRILIGKEYISINSIVALESNGDFTFVYTLQGIYKVWERLGAFIEANDLQNKGISRISRPYALNRSYINIVQKINGKYIINLSELENIVSKKNTNLKISDNYINQDIMLAKKLKSLTM